MFHTGTYPYRKWCVEKNTVNVRNVHFKQKIWSLPANTLKTWYQCTNTIWWNQLHTLINEYRTKNSTSKAKPLHLEEKWLTVANTLIIKYLNKHVACERQSVVTWNWSHFNSSVQISEGHYKENDETKSYYNS
jgi:hypothetical protein